MYTTRRPIEWWQTMQDLSLASKISPRIYKDFIEFDHYYPNSGFEDYELAPEYLDRSSETYWSFYAAGFTFTTPILNRKRKLVFTIIECACGRKEAFVGILRHERDPYDVAKKVLYRGFFGRNHLKEDGFDDAQIERITSTLYGRESARIAA